MKRDVFFVLSVLIGISILVSHIYLDKFDIPNVKREIKNENTTQEYIVNYAIHNEDAITKRENTAPECEPRLPAGRPQDATWQVVEDDVSYVYSAHRDDRERTLLLRLFGLVRYKAHGDRAMFCHLWIGMRLIGETQADISYEKCESYTYAETYFVCNFTKLMARLVPGKGLAVSLTPSRCDKSLNKIQVQYNVRQSPERNFTVCMWSPAYTWRTALTDPVSIIEWIELNKLFGAEKFFIYNSSLNANVSAAVQAYQRTGEVQLYQWTMPTPISQNFYQVHIRAQLVMISDCHYRNIYKSRFVVGVDADEFITPRATGVRTWSDVINNASDCGPAASIYAARHLFFGDSPEWPDDPHCADKYRLRTMCKTERDSTVMTYPARTKYIARPERLTKLKVHNLKINRADVCVLHPDNAGLHHYRQRPTGEFHREPNRTYVQDTRMHVYQNELIQRVDSMMAGAGNNI